MKRRTLLKALAATGALSSVPAWLLRLQAQEATYGGPYWLFINAAGGWDPQFMFDPTEDPEFNRVYSSIGTVGNISYAPIPIDLEALGYAQDQGYESILMTAETFLGKHGSRLAVVNGIDTATNGHDSGKRAMGSGKLTAGYPSLGALIASVRAADMPMAYFSGGGFDATEGLVPLTRVANAGALTRIALPNDFEPGQPDTQRYHTPETMQRIMRAQRERNQALVDAQRLPLLRTTMGDLLSARASTNVLERLVLPEQLIDLPGNDLGDLERFMQQGQMALAAFSSGLSAVASLDLGGFDTHGNHDRDQVGKILKLFAGVDFVIEEAARVGIGDKLFIVATSDFGRGPHYNGGNAGSGKDHWPVTSMFALGPGIRGDRVIGGTDDRQLARPIDPETMAVANEGVTIDPQLVHRALRRVAGVEAEEQAERFPLAGRDLALFG